MAAPRIVAQQGLQVAPAGARLSASDLGAGFGAALVNLGDNAGQMAARQAQLNDQADRAQRLGDLRVQAMSDLAALRGKYANDRDPGTMAQRWGTEADALLDGYKQKYGEDPIFGAFSQDFSQLRLRDQVDVTTDAAKGLAVRGQASLESNIDTLGQMLGASNDPVRTGNIKDMAAAAVGDAVNHGYIDEVEAGKMLRKFVSKGDEARARQLVTVDPEAAAAKLADAKAFPDLDDVKRVQLLDMATRRVDSLRSDRIRLAEKADRDAEKSLKAAGEDSAKKLWALQADGTLTRDSIEAQRKALSTEDYKALLFAEQNGNFRDEPRTIAALETDLGSRDLTEDINAALGRGELTPATYRSLIEKNRALAKDEQPDNSYAGARDYLLKSLKPSDLLPGAAADAARLGASNAAQQFDAWRRANPDAPQEAMQQKAQELVDRYQPLNLKNMRLSLPLPSGYTGARKDVKGADLDAAAAAVLKALDAGSMSKDEAAIELKAIDGWRGVLASDAAGAP